MWKSGVLKKQKLELFGFCEGLKKELRRKKLTKPKQMGLKPTILPQRLEFCLLGFLELLFVGLPSVFVDSILHKII